MQAEVKQERIPPASLTAQYYKRISCDVTPFKRPFEDHEPAHDASLDHAALEALFRAHYQGLYAIAYQYVRSRALAEEVVQDAFLHLWTRGTHWSQARDLKRYVETAVRNRALDHLRRDRLERAWQQAVRDSDDGVLSQFAHEGGTKPDVDDTVERLRDALRTLPDRSQQAIALRMYRQLSNSEIADVMGITIKAVERNISRAVHALRDALLNMRDSTKR